MKIVKWMAVNVLVMALSAIASAADAPATAPSVPLKLTQGHQSLSLPRPAGLSETADSNSDLRVLSGIGGKIKVSLVLLPADQQTDPAAAASVVEISKGALQAAWGANLLIPPTAQADPRFSLVMHWRYRTSQTDFVDETRYWKSIGSVTVQSEIEIASNDEAIIKSANTTVQNLLLAEGDEGLVTADTGPRRRIAVAPVPADGVGEAINDRLKRAAHR